jgi:hypothetical protein
MEGKGMPHFNELDALSTGDLHHMAVKAAEQRCDVKFFWQLVEYIPMAEVMAGDSGEEEQDVQHIASWLHDFAHRGGKLDEALRPVYIDYLEHHPSDAHAADGKTD